MCHIRTQQTRSTEKDEDVNWVRTNLRTGKNHSAERGDAPRKLYCNSAVSCMEVLQNPHGIRADFLEFIGFCKVSCDIYLITHWEFTAMAGHSIEIYCSYVQQNGWFAKQIRYVSYREAST